jgi:hypothetical protein
MDFAPTLLFVVPSTNVYPTTGSTDNLSAGQIGVFRPDYSIATTGNLTNIPYVYICQGNEEPTMPGVGSVRSDKIYKKNVVNWYAVAGNASVVDQIIDITDFAAKCSEDVTISVRIRSFYANTGFFNGLTRSWTITTPCCDCGDDPCDTVDTEALIDAYVAKINADILVNQFLVAEKMPTMGGYFLRINALPIAPDPTRCDPSAFPYQYDQIKFWAWAYKGPETTQDYNVWNNCDPFATVTTVQERSYPIGLSAEIAKLEKDYHSYRVPPIAKHLFKWDIWNNGFVSLVEPNEVYDTFYLEFTSPVDEAWNPSVKQNYRVILAVPQSSSNTNFIDVVIAFFGSPTDESPEVFTTTTTTLP